MNPPRASGRCAAAATSEARRSAHPYRRTLRRPAPSTVLTYQGQLAHERHASRALQHAIQPASRIVRDIHGLQLAVRCHGADPMLALGGDWYLILPLTGGDLIMAVGDAIGHGLDAVDTMIRLRYAMAAYAAEGHPPATILAKLNTLLCHADGDSTATAVIATYRPAMGELRWARAGHPPPLLADHDGVRRLRNPAGPLLGVFPAAEFAEGSHQLLPGQSVLLYTDGLIKRGTFDEGLDLLAERITDGGDPAAVLDRLDFDAAGDDACALMVRRPEPGPCRARDHAEP